MTRVSPDKPNEQERRNGSKGIGRAILPVKRVTIAEGRALGQDYPGKGDGER